MCFFDKSDNAGRRQEMKWGCFGGKKENWGCFVKKLTFPQRRVHYVQYQYFLFYIILIWGAYAPNAPPAYGPVMV